jgi:ubiquinone biosynthesis monooxygenase Coq6
MFKRLLATAAAAPRLQDVVIIGGGPAGLSLLAALKSLPVTRHLECTLVEAQPLLAVRQFGVDPPEDYTNRVVLLTPKLVEFMDARIGSWRLLNHDRLKFYNSIVAYDSQDRTAAIAFDDSLVKSPFLAVMAETINIQLALLQRVDEVGGDVIDATKVVSIDDAAAGAGGAAGADWPVVTLSDGTSLQTRLLVGADGYNSPVRHYAGIELRGWAYNRFGVVATVRLQFEDYRAIAWQRFLTTGPLAILPLTEDNATIVWLLTPELAEVLLKTDERIFAELINAAMTLDEVSLDFIYAKLRQDPTDASVLEDIAWRQLRLKVADLETNYPLPVVEVVKGLRARFPLKMLHADTYTGHRCALVGDAAHTVHPLAGQGLNMGQGDVELLVNALENGVRRGLDIGLSLVLEPYTSAQWPANHVLLGVCDKLHKIFATSWAPVVFLRGAGMKSLNMLDSLKDLMIKTISGR